MLKVSRLSSQNDKKKESLLSSSLQWCEHRKITKKKKQNKTKQKLQLFCFTRSYFVFCFFLFLSCLCFVVCLYWDVCIFVYLGMCRLFVM